MSSNTLKVAVPIMALAGVGIATGGFGLAAAGASGAAGAGAAGVAAGLPALAPATTVGLAPGVTTAGLAASNTAAASTGFSSLFTGLATKSNVGLAFSGLGLGSNLLGAKQQADADKANLQAQEAQQTQIDADARADLAIKERDNQFRVAEALSSVATYFGARGAAPGVGSARTATDGIVSGGAAEADTLAAGLSSLDSANISASRLRRSRAKQSRSATLGRVAGGFLDFGRDIYRAKVQA